MDRAGANAYLLNEYRELATDAKFSTSQTSAAYSTAIDMSLLQLGFTESELATANTAESDALKYRACLNYYALSRFAKLLAIRFDVKAGSGAIDAARSQAFRAIESLKAQAAEELAQYGVNVGGTESFVVGRFALDIYEPSTTSGSEF